MLNTSHLIPIEFQVEILGKDGNAQEQVQWACNVDPTAKWGDINYGAIAMIKASNKAKLFTNRMEAASEKAQKLTGKR